MLEAIICYLIAKLNQTNYFEQSFALASLARKSSNEDALRPVIYTGKGQLKDITVYDHRNGVSYFRLSGKENSEEINNDEMVPCRTELQIIHPLRLIACVPKSKLSKDDAFSDDRVANSLRKVLTENAGPLKNALKANSVSFSVTSINTNHREILGEEYPGADIKEINFNYSLAAIEFNATVKIYSDCIESECNVNVTDFELPAPQTLCDAVESCDVIQNILSELQNIITSDLEQLELISGDIDGNNKVFEWNDVPKLVFWQNGKLVKNATSNGYTISGNITTFTDAPELGDSVEAYK